MLRQTVVRVSIKEDSIADVHWGTSLVECLRYAGLIEIQGGPCQSPDELCFDILPPQGEHNEVLWARMNADRMKSFGFDAEVAPRCHENAILSCDLSDLVVVSKSND